MTQFSHPLLHKGHDVCIASPETLQIEVLCEVLDFRHVESHLAFIHRSLRREIAVFEKVQKQ
jgi:tRNA G10  N-methylase Trm11